MVQKATIVSVIDKCGIFTGNIFHIYKGFNHKFGNPRDFLKFSSRLVSPSLPELKGQKFNSILVRASKYKVRLDGSIFTTKTNSVVSLKKRLTPRGKELIGPSDKRTRRKKFLLTFSGIY